MLGHDCHLWLALWVFPVNPILFIFYNYNTFFHFFPRNSHSHLIWDWELDSEFERNLLAFTKYSPRSVNWVDWLGNPVGVSTGVTVLDLPEGEIDQIIRGEKLGDPSHFTF